MTFKDDARFENCTEDNLKWVINLNMLWQNHWNERFVINSWLADGI